MELKAEVTAAQADEPEFTRNKVRAFLNGHTCYELIPESGKVVVLDVGLPIRQAFHALHEQVGTTILPPLLYSLRAFSVCKAYVVSAVRRKIPAHDVRMYKIGS